MLCLLPHACGAHETMTPFYKVHAHSHKKGAYVHVCPITYIWWKESRHEVLLLNYLTPSAAGKLLSNLIALRAFLLSSLNCFMAASFPLLLVPVLSFHLSSSSPSPVCSLHQSSFGQAKQSPLSSTVRSSLSPLSPLPVPFWRHPGTSGTVCSVRRFRAFWISFRCQILTRVE